MPLITIVCGILLTLVGFGGYANAWVNHSVDGHVVDEPAAGITPDAQSWSHPKYITALIPAAFGVPLIVLGGMARNERFLKHAMHVAASIGLIGFLLPAFMLPNKILAIRSRESFNWSSLAAQAAMAGICLVFLALCLNSFLVARRRRAAAAVESAIPN